MRGAFVFVPFCALTGSLALPQTISGTSVVLPGVDLSPADQTACIQSCSQSVADNRPDALDACLDATYVPSGKSAPNCLCNDDILSAEMQKCFGARCPPLQGHCAAILAGSSSISGTGLSSTGSPGTPGTSNQSSGTSISFPDVQLPPAQQTACVQSCSEDVADNEPDALDACVSATGTSAANCLCTDATLAAEMQKCFGARCAPLQGRCAALDSDGGIFIAGTTGSTGGSTPGTASGGTSAPGGAGTSSPGTVSGGTSAPGSAGAGTPGGAAGASGPSSDNGAGANTPGASAPGAQPAPESGVPESSSGTSPSAAGASPSTPSSAADDVNPDAGGSGNSAGVNGAFPLALALALGLAFTLF